jgi:hypothetical protein
VVSFSEIYKFRVTYAKFLTASDSKQVFSISHLNETLGDLHFFDQEYDDAIVAYSDAIRPINISITVPQDMPMEDFVLLVRNKLKTGLCFEKISSYEDALSHYADSCLDSTRFLLDRLENKIFLDGGKGENELFETNTTSDRIDVKETFFSPALSDLLQLISQCFLAQMFIQEKKSVAGISELKVCISLGSFLKLTEKFLLHRTRNRLIKANMFLHTGNLLYFKNSDKGLGLNKNKITKANHLTDQRFIAYRKILPHELNHNLRILILTYDDDSLKWQYKGKPLLALYMYIIGLTETWIYRNGPQSSRDLIKNTVCANGNIAAGLLRLMEKDEHEEKEMFRGIHYNYLASFLSNIGDCLLSIYTLDESKTDKEAYKKITIGSLFKAEELRNLTNSGGARSNCEQELGFLSCLNPVNNDIFSLSDVLRCYYLAGRYYLKQGRSLSASFQYRKILYVLRLIIDKQDGARGILGENFLKMIGSTILDPILKFASHNASNTDNHMLNKARPLAIDDHYSINNLSNHPETGDYDE